MIIVLVLIPVIPLKQVRADTVPNFVFTASGDYGNTIYTNSTLDNILKSGASFNLALGDLGYLRTWNGSEEKWCNVVKAHVGNNFPFELIVGNHEDSFTDLDGFIGNYASCLPDRIAGISYKAGYAKEYFFDYPTASPIARIIMVAAAIAVSGNVSYPYSVGSKSYNWLSQTINDAKSKGYWVIVGMHKDCITVGKMQCEVGPDLMNLILSKRVDLILQAHDHEYQRSKQLVCADSPAKTTQATFVPSCVVDDGSDGQYVKGAGSVIVISGDTGGGEFGTINVNDPEAPYFAAWMGKNSTKPDCGCTPGRGTVKYNVTASRITAEFVPSTKPTSNGFFTTQYRDSFTIGPPIPLGTSFTYSPAFPTVGTAVNLTAKATGGQLPYAFNWNFGDNTTGTGTSAIHSYTSAGKYNVTLVAVDRTGQKAQASANITVSQPLQFASVILLPAGPGSSTIWLPTSTCSGANWDCVNDGTVSDGDITYVRCGSTSTCPSGSAASDLYALQRASQLMPAGSTIQWVKVFIISRKASSLSDASIAITIMLGNQMMTATTIQLTTSYLTNETQWSFSPFSKTPWTISELDSLQVGQTYVAGTASARVTAIRVEVGYVTP